MILYGQYPGVHVFLLDSYPIVSFPSHPSPLRLDSLAVASNPHPGCPKTSSLQDTSTWTIPHGVNVPELQSRLSSAAVHPVFLLTDTSLENDYRALIGEIGFGTVAAVDPADAVATNYNDDYLPQALKDGLEALYAQAALLVQSDDGGFVADIAPTPDAFRAYVAGTEVSFAVGMSATSSSSTGSGEVTLSFQGHKVGGACAVNLTLWADGVSLLWASPFTRANNPHPI